MPPLAVKVIHSSYAIQLISNGVNGLFAPFVALFTRPSLQTFKDTLTHSIPIYIPHMVHEEEWSRGCVPHVPCEELEEEQEDQEDFLMDSDSVSSWTLFCWSFDYAFGCHATAYHMTWLASLYFIAPSPRNGWAHRQAWEQLRVYHKCYHRVPPFAILYLISSRYLGTILL